MNTNNNQEKLNPPAALKSAEETKEDTKLEPKESQENDETQNEAEESTPRSIVRIVSVPTKTFDGGGDTSTIFEHPEHDAFMRYSDTRTRMNALLGVQQNEEDDRAAGALIGRAHDVDQEQEDANLSVRRRTRISFEVHDSLLLDS